LNKGRRLEREEDERNKVGKRREWEELVWK